MERKSLAKDGTKLSNKTRILSLHVTILKIAITIRLSDTWSVVLVFPKKSETNKSKIVYILILASSLPQSVI